MSVGTWIDKTSVVDLVLKTCCKCGEGNSSEAMVDGDCTS
jgi:hypothetical protein